MITAKAFLGALIGLVVGFFIAFIVGFVFALGQSALGSDPTGNSAGNAAFRWTWLACIAFGALVGGKVRVDADKPDRKIERLKETANSKNFHFKALGIARDLGNGNIFERGQLRIEITEHKNDFGEDTRVQIRFNGSDVYSDRFMWTTHSYNRYGTRYVLESDDRSIDHEIDGYVPGSWEKQFFAASAEAEKIAKQREDQLKSERLKQERARFGIT